MSREDGHCSRCGSVLDLQGECFNCLLELGLSEKEPVETGLPRIPSRVGKYEILGEISRGAMGIVFRARQPGADRDVALKVISSGQFATPAELARFYREARTTGSLEHANIVPIHDVGEDEGRPFFTMRLIAGADLSRSIEDLAGNSKRAAALIAKIARAVHHAHQRGVLHRDLKPSNILLDEFGEPHITDFGLAKSADATLELTVSGAALGTPGYMAPEQAAGDSRQVTTAADIFSLGALLYHVLTGRPPFQAETPLAAIRKTLEEEPMRPSLRAPKLDRDLETICLKALAKKPVDRYASAEAMAEDLERWLRHEPISARPPTPLERVLNAVRRHPVRSGIFAVIALMILLVATFAYGSYATYFYFMRRIISEQHLIVPPDRDGVYRLSLYQETTSRCTFNFWIDPFFRDAPQGAEGRYARLLLTNIPPDLAREMRFMVFADVPVLADPAKTPELADGEIFLLGRGQKNERAFYLTALNFQMSNILAAATNPGVQIVLLGYRGDANPYQPAGRLTGRERY